MADLLQQYNKYVGENKNLIQKALTSASSSGGALIPEFLEQIITNAVPRISPEMSLITPEYGAQNIHSFNRLTALGSAGGAMGEAAVTPVTQPTFTRDTVTLKVIRRKGSTTNFLQDTSKENLDAAAANIEAELTSHVYSMSNYIMYGNAGSNAYEFSGWDTFITTNRVDKAGAAPTDLTDLDDLLDRNFELQGMSHRKAFIMSPQMLSKYSSLLTNVRLNQGLTGNFSQVDVPGGWRLNAYRDTPIIVSGGCRPKTQMTTVTPSTAAGSGTIPDATARYFQVAGVTLNGEEIACAEVTQTTGSGGGNDNTITLTFAANTSALRYKVYVGSVSGTVYLRHVVPGFTYDTNGTITGSTTNTFGTVKSIASDANGNVTSITFLSDPNTAATEVPTGLQTDVPLGGTVASPEEIVFMIDFDSYQGLGKYAYTNSGGSQFNGMVTIEDLARTDDNLPFLIKTYGALVDAYEATSSILRRVKTA